MSDIIINEVNFKKIATKVNQRFAVNAVETLGKKYPELHVEECIFKHTTILNMLAEAMGFNNYHHIQQYFNKDTTKQIINYDHQKEFFLSMDENLLYSFLLNSINGDSNDHWVKRSYMLLDIGVKLFYWRIKEEVEFNPTSQQLENCFDMDILHEYSTKENLDEKIKFLINGYLISLPGYNSQSLLKAKWSNSEREQHGYLKIQFTSTLALLHKLNYDLTLLTKELFNQKNPNEDYLEYFSNFSTIKSNIDAFFNDNIKFTIKDILILYNKMPSVHKRKSVLSILQYSINNQDVIKQLIK